MAALIPHLINGLTLGLLFALIALGFTLIVGVMEVINLAHGTLFALGAYIALTILGGTWLVSPDLVAWWLSLSVATRYMTAIIFAPLVAAIAGMVLELCLLPTYGKAPLYGLLLTFGLALLIEGLFRQLYGVSGRVYPIPDVLRGGTNLGFMFLPNYRAFVVVVAIVVCIGVWLFIERTRIGSYLRAGTENPELLKAFGVNVPLMITLTFGLGVGLAAMTGVLAAPIYQVHPLMGFHMIIMVFAVVVIGGLGSMLGAIVTGLMLGVIEGFTRVFYPEASATVVFILMAIVLLLRPQGLFGKR
jgi:branched-chain amino acid transport system permease protein